MAGWHRPRLVDDHRQAAAPPQIDSLLARIEYAGPGHTYSDLTVARGKALCITCPVALQFEWRRIADWVAYHSLLGVDCFVLFIDESKLAFGSAAALSVLLAAPTVKLFRCPRSDGSDGVRNKPFALIKGLERMRPHVRPRAYMYIDVDEYVAVRADLLPRDSSIRGALVRMADRVPGDGVYLHRWQYGTSGFDAPPSLTRTPEFALLTSRYGVNAYGKMLLRLGRGVRLENMHTIRSNPNVSIRLADGKRVNPAYYYVDSAAMQSSRRQPLSLNHFNTGSRQECLDKSRHTGFQGARNRRGSPQERTRAPHSASALSAQCTL